MKPLVSLNDFAHRMGIPRQRLENVARDIGSHYRVWTMIDTKNPAKIRVVRSPRAELKTIQRLLIDRIFSLIPLHESVHGGVRGRSTASNASAHLQQRCVVTLDVREFFQHVRHEIVFSLFRNELGLGREIARLVTQLTTYLDELPRGAPTSPAIANLLLNIPVDGPVADAAAKANVSYTRFIDDIALSGDNPRSLINRVATALSSRRLPMYRAKAKFQSKSKLKIMPNNGPQEVTGLLVNSRRGPSLSKRRRDKVRAAIRELHTLVGPAHSDAIARVRGRIQYVGRYNPGSEKRLTRSLDSQR
jgi:RNA-directed DNA polymerase